MAGKQSGRAGSFLSEPARGGAAAPVAVCFFGITRSLKSTLGSIEANVLGPARSQGPVLVCAHFFRQREIHDPRSGESGTLDPDEHLLLAPDRLELEEPEACLNTWDFEALKAHGDYWQTGFRSLRNLVHQLHSLDRVTQAALDGGARVCIFARPDLAYHDSLARPLRTALKAPGELVQLPYWQPWHGRNDRFAVVSGRRAIAAYGQRIRQARAFCEATGGPMHSEKLLAWALQQAGVEVQTIRARASRVRLDGSVVEEDFTHPVSRRIRRDYRMEVDPLLRWMKGHALFDPLFRAMRR